MIFRIDRIEIQQQPERKRFWAEVEALTPSGFRRQRIETPDIDGYWGILNAIGAFCDEYAPKPEVARQSIAVQESDPSLDTLRAEAEAAGVRVDKRWGEARLREVVATVARGGAAQDA